MRNESSPALTVRTRTEGADTVVVSVSDSGTAAHRGNKRQGMFDSVFYHQEGRSGDGAAHLPIESSRNTADASGGENNPRAGATFSFSLKAGGTSSNEDPGAVIYVVEDDPSFRKSIERLIRALGHEGGLLRFGRRLPGAVLYSAAGMFASGCATSGLRRSRASAKAHGAGQQPADRVHDGARQISRMTVKAMKHGAVEFLPKPFKTAGVSRAPSRARLNVMFRTPKGKSGRRKSDS